MNAEKKGKDLFIVDNSVSGWTGLRYLEEWTGIAKAFDIATGYFEIGALIPSTPQKIESKRPYSIVYTPLPNSLSVNEL